MVLLIGLWGVLVFGIPVLVIILFVVLFGRTKKLRKRLEAVEQYLNVRASTEIQPVIETRQVASASVAAASALGSSQSDKAEIAPPQTFAPSSSFAQAPSPLPAPAPIPTPLKPEGPDSYERFSKWLKEDWLLKLGALLVLIAFGWLASYAFIHQWIGPMGRITLGVVLGALVMALGFWRMRRFVHQGAIFLVVGSTVVILTIFAARSIYDFFTPVVALLVMFITSALVAWVSVLYRRRPLAIASLILAAIAPMLVSSLEVFAISQFTYLFVIVLGTIWVVAITRWRILNTIALAIVTLYSLPNMLATGFAEDIFVFVFIAFAFAALFFISNVAGIIRNADNKSPADIVTALWNGLLLLGWIVAGLPEEWQSLVIVAWMVVFLVAAFLIAKRTRRLEAFLAYAGVGVLMLATATAIELSGAVLTMAFTAEAAALTLVVYLVLRNLRIAQGVSSAFLVPVILSFPSFISSQWYDSILHEDFFVLLILGLVFLILGLFFLDQPRRVEGGSTSTLHTVFLVVSTVYLLALVWLATHALMAPDPATMLSLLVYTLLGLVGYLRGRNRGLLTLTTSGGILLGLVVARLVFVDVWKLELTGRIITFFVIGTLLMSTAFLVRGKRAGSGGTNNNIDNNNKQ